ncbi:MAG: DUF935 domain-containing protein [Arenicellales bacterium]
MQDKTINKMNSKKTGVLASEVASRATDPLFYSGLTVLPNPDTVLRAMNRGQEIYDAIEYDAHVMGELRSIRAGILSWEWRLQPGGDRPQDIEAFELCLKLFQNRPDTGMSWSDTIWNISRAIFHGLSVHEVMWQRNGKYLIPDRVVDRPQRRFQFDTDNKIRLITKSNMMPGDELDDYKFLLTRHMVRSDNPYGTAIFSSCFWPYTFKHAGYRYFAKFVERYGIPSPVGKYPLGTTQDMINEMLDKLAGLVEDNVAAIPDNGSVELLESTAGQQAIHNTFINLCNRELSKALTSQTLATEVQGEGSRAASETHAEREEGGHEADREMVASTLQMLCDWTAAINFPDAKPPKWEFFDEGTISKELVETVETAAGVVPLKKSEVYSRLQFTPPEEGDDVVFLNGKKKQPNPDSEFSSCRHCGGYHFAAGGRDELDDLVDQADDAAQEFIESMTQEVRDLLDEVDDLEEFAARLPDLMPGKGEEELGEVVTAASIIARLNGIDVQ